MARDRLIVAIAGDAGAVYGIRALEAVRRIGTIETHLLVGRATAAALGLSKAGLQRLADIVHDQDGAGPSLDGPSTMGLLVAPCPTETLRIIADEDNTGLLARTAAACLAERRRVVLLAPQTHLDPGIIQLMAKASRLGAVIVPPVPAFYHRPKTLDDIIDQTVGRTLDLFGIESGLVRRWTEDDRPAP